MQSPPTLARGPVSRPAEAQAGPLLLGRYRPLERLGAGGFGVVWRARDEHEGGEVAIKRIPLGPGADAARAAREALAVGRLSHPAIVRLHEARFSDDGFYLVSELVRGPTLGRLFERGAPDDAQLLDIIHSVAQALVHAHAHGVIHRDVKPHNILVDEYAPGGAASAKLTDFGGAQLAGEEALTRTGDVVGTLAYMAPEQADGRGAGPSADLYSLALVLYEGLVGANPVRGSGPADTARRLGRPLPPLGPQRPDLSPPLVHAIEAALHPQPSGRGRLEHLIEALAQGSAAARTRHARGGRAAGLGDRPRRRGRLFAGRPLRPLMTSSPAPQAPIAARGADSRPPLALAPRLGGALAAGLLMTAALRLLFAQPGYAPAGGVLAAAAVAMAPRLGWLAASAFLITWLAVTGAPGAALIVACAVLPVALTLRRPGPAWSAPALAPLAGVAGVAGLFPALAAQSGSWPRRASVGALGFWWLMLAQPLASRRLWLGPPDGSLERAAWAHTLSGAVTHALEPLLIPGMLAGAALWALGAAVLPWLVRGRNAARDLLAASTWGVLLAVGAGSLERSLVPVGGASWPRGLVLGTVGAVLLAVGGRALRGPGRPLGRAHPPAIGRRESEGQEPV